VSRLEQDPGVREVMDLLSRALSGCVLLGLKKTDPVVREAIKVLRKETTS
jgi:hypothetical protein